MLSGGRGWGQRRIPGFNLTHFLQQSCNLFIIYRMIDRFKEVLKSSGNSVTAPRQAIFALLMQEGPLTAAQIASKCAPTVDRATAYRTIELFERLGIVNRIWHGFKSSLELSEIFTPHHHHATCEHCGTHLDITSPELERALAGVAKQHKFLAISHTLELTGYCGACQIRQS